MRHSNFIRATCGGFAATLCASASQAIVITIDPFETPFCDPLVLPNVVHELGNPPLFPVDELIETTFTFTNLSACPAMDNPNVPNVLLVMTNLTPTPWFDVHYVADGFSPAGGTSITNEDGLVSGGQAFRIDVLGVNRPLVFESITANTIFEPGETWHFIIQDYFNAPGLPPSAMGSIGVGFGSGGDPISSGSIIALIPGPSGLLTLALGFIALRTRRRPQG